MSESGDPNDPAPRPCGSSSLRPPRPKSQVGTPPGPRTAPRDGGFARPCLGLAFQPPATMGRGASSLRRPLSSASAQAAAVTTPQGPRMAPSRSAGRRPAGRHLEEGRGQPCGPRGFSPPSPPAGPRRGRPGCPARVPAAAQCQLTGRELQCHLGRLYPRETVSLWVRQSTPSPELPHRPLERLCHPPGARCPPASGPGGPGGPGLSRHVQRETPASWPCWSGLVWF